MFIRIYLVLFTLMISAILTASMKAEESLCYDNLVRLYPFDEDSIKPEYRSRIKKIKDLITKNVRVCCSGNFNNVTISSNLQICNGNVFAKSISLQSPTLLTYNKGGKCNVGEYVLRIDGPTNIYLGLDTRTIGTPGFSNIAIGDHSLSKGGTVNSCIAIGARALQNSISGGANIAIGEDVLREYGSGAAAGSNNIVIGSQSQQQCRMASYSIMIGSRVASNNILGTTNLGIGTDVLTSHTTGSGNLAIGNNVLADCVSGITNIAIGMKALQHTTGTSNVALGHQAGINNDGSNNTYIGSGVVGELGDNRTVRIGLISGGSPANRCFIGGINGVTISSGLQVLINNSGQLGRNSSSQRYKENIQDMGDVTQNLFNLRPVTFNYIEDDSKHLEYGLIAEEVEELYPGIVVKDEEGLPSAIQYQYLPMIMLNEIIKRKYLIEALQQEAAYLQQQNEGDRSEFLQVIDELIKANNLKGI